jgi:GT2 family glycosyltransferase
MLSRLSWRYRRALSVLQRVRASVALRGWRNTLTRISGELKTRPSIDDSLSLLALDGTTTGLELLTSDAPHVSVIIPVYQNLAHTLACLRSIQAQPPTSAFEVIVVDDASPDGSAATLDEIVGIRLVRQTENRGFVGTCNTGAQVARGQFLIFLNNDTQVTAGWTEELLRCFLLRPSCGIAGSQLVYPDGRLQEAGAWVFSDASAWNRGRFESRADPRMRYAREVDYVSGASLAIRREVFAQMHGFDTRFSPGYYEDTDLAFAVRAAGMSVWYVPGSVVVHAEGISSRGEGDTGMKRFQAINRVKFAQKWADLLHEQPAPGTPLAVVERAAYRGTIFVADVATPEISRDSGSLRLVTIMQLLVEDGWHVAFAPDDGRTNNQAIRELGRLGIETIARPWVDGIPSWLAKEGSQISAAILCRHTVANQYTQLVRRYAPQAKLIFDTVDLHFLREERAASSADNGTFAKQAEATRRQELRLIQQADTTFVVSDYERELLRKLTPEAHVDLLSNIHDVYGRTHAFAGRRDLLFIGGYGHPPNSDAMHWMASDILPVLRRMIPDIEIFVAGDIPPAEQQSLQAAGLRMLGRVPDLAHLMSSCLASIAPLRFGAGVKGKINMAMSYGLPVIGSTVAVEGMKLTDGLDVLVADTPDDIAACYLRLMQSESLWTSLSDRALANVELHFSPSAALETLRRTFD